jgi:mono/diheme cytochrome c family protein
MSLITSVRNIAIPLALAILLVPAIVAKRTPPAAPSGREIFMDRCGACHGEDAKGNGPAVGSLKVPPADLTLLAQRNGGAFPAERVKNIVGDWVDITAHGSREMPVWGSLFHPKDAADQQKAGEQFQKLVGYLESIQQ